MRRIAALVTATLMPFLAVAADLPRVVSINLCTDQLLLTVADPGQIASVSWLSADPQESMLAREARAYPLNYGTAEEVLGLEPDVVLGGSYTNVFTRRLLQQLGYRVVVIEPANTIDDIERNIRLIADAIGRVDEGERTIAAMRVRAGDVERQRPARRVTAIVVRPGGFTVGARTLADELMRLAGLDNIAADNGLDRWGSLSLESLISSRPELMIRTGYRTDQASLANAVFDHPVMAIAHAKFDAAIVETKFWACGLPASLTSSEKILAALQSAGRR